MRIGLLLLFCAAAAGAATAPFAQCVELPYPAMPRQFWERELVWMKNIGVGCVALPDSPDLQAILGTARKLEMPAWILTNAPTAQLRAALDPITEAHGGPVRWIGEAAAPQPIVRVSATDIQGLAISRAALEKQAGTILWTDVESTNFPALHKGAISFTGEEQPTLASLRRNLQLLPQWAPLLPQFNTEQRVHTATGKLPSAVSARQFTSPDPVAASMVSIVNRGTAEFHAELRVLYPPAKQLMKLPEIMVPAHDSLWIPINLPLAKAQSCKACAPFANGETIVYATAELTRLEYENGLLAMEFSSPSASEIVLHLASEPAGPYLAAGKPRTFDWDASSGRVRLPIPAGTGLTHKVRVGLALTAPETSAFFSDRKVFTIGQRNAITATYSSEEVAKRSRVIAPAWLKLETLVKSPNQMEYSFSVPASALHGSHIDLAIETDGAQVTHTRLQLLRPATLRIREAVSRHLGNGVDLPLDPPLIPVDQKSGRDLSITVRNNAPEIRTFVLNISGDSLDFTLPRTEVVVAGSSERDITVRVFADHAAPGPHTAILKLSGGAVSESEIKLLVIPRGETVRYADGIHTVLESQRARAVFTADRWMEFVWKDSERNLLPEGGLALGTAQILSLEGAALTTVGGALNVRAGKQSDINLAVTTPEAGRTVYTLSR